MAPRRDGGVEALLDDVARRRADDEWDVAICLTDLPLHAERVPLVAQTSARRRAAVVSLPALGLHQLRAARLAVPDLVSRLLSDAPDQRVPPAGSAPAETARQVPAVHRMIGEADAGERRYVASGLIGRVRLLAGMVRANRPGVLCWACPSCWSARSARPRSHSPRTPSGRWAMRSADSGSP
ncbi:hypothetical protein [Micromonospora sp. ALFpr18c]|uniref:hypothetical protein n=1 Tax=Micromonospora sp. ALFpr18c TaxID=1458665 RepID=UPI001CEC81A2|nr:hypothetical protein [Micromonospora sp. ALFpr18c]